MIDARRPTPPLRLVASSEHLSAGAPAAGHGRLLLSARFGSCGGWRPVAEAPQVSVANRVLGGAVSEEHWVSERPVHCGRRGAVAWAADDRVLCGALTTPLTDCLTVESQVHFAELLATIEAEGYPHLLRVWNFLPGINSALEGAERYGLFNVGRAAAFDQRYGTCAAEARFSASSAVGTSGDSLVSWFVAARSPGVHLGNPRQVHAYRYPPEYGPRSPSFSRATIAPPELGGALFLSGTASIAGYETRHVGVLQHQLEETLRNIDALLEAGRAIDPELPGLAEFDLVRVYLRYADDLEAIREPLLSRLGANAAVMFVEADICRADLLLEIEGVARVGEAKA